MSVLLGLLGLTACGRTGSTATTGVGGKSSGFPDEPASAGSSLVAQSGPGTTLGGGASDPGLVETAGTGGAAQPSDGGAGGNGGEGPVVAPTFAASADGRPVDPIIPGAGFAWQLTVGDLNGDGHQDIVWGRDFDGALVALGRGDGTFQSAGVYAGTTQSEQTTVFGLGLVDLDRDGDLDLAIATSFANDPLVENRLALLTNDGTGHFVQTEEIKLSDRAALGLGNMVAADLNGDGLHDLVFGSGFGLHVLLNRAGAHAVTDVKGLKQLAGLAAADLDGDGDVDLVLTGNVFADSVLVGSVMKTLINDGHAAFTEGETHTLGATSSNAVAIADLDGDSVPDVVVATPGANGVNVLSNHGDGTFTEPRLIPTEASRSIVLADLNGDAWVDIAVSGDNSVRGIAVLANDRHGGFRLGERFLTTPFDAPIAMVGSDFNEDGAVDLANTAGTSIVVWLNQLR